MRLELPLWYDAPRRPSRSVTLCSMVWVFVACLGGTLCAEDRVTLIPAGAVDPVILIGSIEDYTGLELVLLRPGVASSDRYPANTIQSVQTWRSPMHEQGISELDAGTTSLAEQSLLQALKDEPRDWVKREILALLVRCAIRRHDWGTAGTRFLQITKQDAATPHWNIAPIQWAPQSLGDNPKTMARAWLNGTDPSSRLLAASWLLLDPVSGETAHQKLDDLARDPNRIINSYARSQLWRLRLGLELSELEVEKWRKEVRRMPRSFRAGPQYLVGRGLLQRSEPGAAAAELLWLPMVYHENEDLSARALVDAAGALEQTGQTQAALTLYDSVVARYGWSPWASEARHARSVLSSPADSSENPPRE
jgi:hypothetical protein